MFRVENGSVVVAPVLSTKPGERLTVREWMAEQARVSDFACLPSRGTGSRSPAPVLLIGAKINSRELLDPAPEELQRHAADIAAGRLKVVFTDFVLLRRPHEGCNHTQASRQVLR